MKFYYLGFLSLGLFSSLVTATTDENDKTPALRAPYDEHRRMALNMCELFLPNRGGGARLCSCDLALDDQKIVVAASCSANNQVCAGARQNICGFPHMETKLDIIDLIRREGTPFSGKVCYKEFKIGTIDPANDILGGNETELFCFDVGNGLKEVMTGGGFKWRTFFPFMGAMRDKLDDIFSEGMKPVVEGVLGLVAAGLLEEEEGDDLIKNVCEKAEVGAQKCNSCTGCLSEDGEVGINFDCTNIDPRMISTSCAKIGRIPMNVADVANFDDFWVPQLD